MKKLFNIIVCSTAVFIFSSCSFFEEDKSPKETAEVKTIIELPDSVRSKILEQDSLMAGLLNKVDTLTKELNATKTENAELKEKVEELKSPRNTWVYVSMGAFILGLISLIVAISRPKEKKVLGMVKRCLDSSRRIKDLQEKVNFLLSPQRNNGVPQSGAFNNSNNETRLLQLEKQMSQVMADVNKMKSSDRSKTGGGEPHGGAEYQKVGYAKNEASIYFFTIYESNQEGCVFKITFMSQDKGKFNIISLDKIQSRNDWQQKVECSGISIREASCFKVEEEGVCEKIDADTWKVTKPLKIRLLK